MKIRIKPRNLSFSVMIGRGRRFRLIGITFRNWGKARRYTRVRTNAAVVTNCYPFYLVSFK